MASTLSGLLLALAAASGLAAADSKDAGAPGVVVERTTPAFEAARVGIQPGDVLLSWERGANPPANPTAASGSFRSPFDVTEAFIDQSPRARTTIALTILRDGKRLTIPIGQYPWRVETRPMFSVRWFSRYEDGRRLVEQGDSDKGLETWRHLAAALSAAGRHVESAWLWRRAGMKLSELKQVDPAIAALDRGLEEARSARRPEAESQLFLSEAEVYRAASRRDDAQRAGRKAVAIREQSGAEGLAVAYTLQELVPSIPSESPEYEASVRRSLRIRERQAPGSRAEAASLQILLQIVNAKGDSGTSVELGRRALAIHERLNPVSNDVAKALSNLCVVQMNRGELAAAESDCQRSLEQWRALGPGELAGLAQILHNMGVLARLRGELDRAVGFFFQSIEIAEKATQNNPYNAFNYFDLGVTELERDLDRAEQYLDRSDQLRGREQSVENVSSALRPLVRANIAYRRKDLAGAEKLLRRSLAYFDDREPNHPVTSYIRDDLGRVLTESGQTKEAEDLLRRALAQRQQYAPRSQESAQSHYNLGMLFWKTGRLAEAEASLKQAIDDFEAQKSKLGGSDESMSMFAGRFSDFYKDYVRLLIERRREQDAFLILERYRAGAFLRTLAQRDLASPDDVPPDLDRERRQTNGEYDRTQAEIQSLQPAKQAGELAGALARLGELRRKQEDIAERIAKASPRYAALRYPTALSLPDARAALDAGTLLLSYAVGKDESYVFALDAARGLAVFTLPVGERDLRESVAAFRKLIAWNTRSPELEKRARMLYDTLLAPVETLVARSGRLLILPDGPLHTLPWAALARNAGPGDPRYLVEWKPIHVAASATVFAELKKGRSAARTTSSIEVAAFGDPKYPPGASRGAGATRGDGGEDPDAYGEPQLDAMLRSGFRLEPLPLSRDEVETIANLYAPRSAAYLGEQATEARARSVGRDVPLIHYACHAIVDERSPLDSALVFSIPEKPLPDQDNGLLQAWEILEKMRIDADLVTLSACESGLGREAGGEGLVGLTRAFQFAGAHSVLASLWKVDDRSTAELMKRFYRYLKAGRPKDESLRLAQTDLIRSGEFAQPRFWAAFQLNGDWR
jgi:CHAT domain-containing protein/tetratricopeptide (TPR) repeat protein